MKELFNLNEGIQYIKGVGPAKSTTLNRLGIYTVKEMLEYYPRMYEDRTVLKKIVEFQDGEMALFTAKINIDSYELRRFRKNLNVIKFTAFDETDSCSMTWFNQPYLKDSFKQEVEYVFYGKVVKDRFGYSVENATVYSKMDLYHVMGIYPIYPLTSGMTQKSMFQIISNIFDHEFSLEETLSQDLLKEYHLCPINEATEKIHFPKTFSEVATARNRLIFDELFELIIALKLMRKNRKKEQKINHFSCTDIAPFLEILPFSLTNAQTRTVQDIIGDLKSSKLMNRMVQGDVGSGKTIVAEIAMYLACKNGYQAAMMAPTTILAIQHYHEAKAFFDKLGYQVEVITSATTKKQKEKIIQGLKDGSIHVVIGTHSLIEDNVEFKNLALVITDEQHRFGVKQRMKLTSKATDVETLVMTATPIPRTLSLMLYGDLDLSLIDELPPGRKRIQTFVVDKSYEERIRSFISKNVDQGRQAYVVCPLVESEEENYLKSVQELYEEYKDGEFKKYSIGIIHGKMKNKEKDEMMQKFKNNEISILISTTVIEVGVNVPNATLMIIENSERFGLSALHQLRGRVGRGEHESFCILKCGMKSPKIMERLKIMEKSNNGFEIAEKDLELRGPGDYFGVRQSGLPEFKLADLLKDVKMLNLAQRAAEQVIKKDANLEHHLALKNKVLSKFGQQLEHMGV